ncbi:MAG: MerR family transcriptional regulator, partial [Pseudomonadota bacterium]
MDKSPDAFRTISEVSEWLGIQSHVLRFWESKFAQIKPVKRAGGRRYYRPSDMLLIGGIKKLLHDDGMTIKGVQKVLREQGIAHVSAQSQGLDDVSRRATAVAGAANVVTFQRREKALPPLSETTKTPATAPEEPDFYPEAAQHEAATTPAEDNGDQGTLPGFLSRPSSAKQAAPKARMIDVADPPPDNDMPAISGCLSQVVKLDDVSLDVAGELLPLLQALRALHARMVRVG